MEQREGKSSAALYRVGYADPLRLFSFPPPFLPVCLRNLRTSKAASATLLHVTSLTQPFKPCNHMHTERERAGHFPRGRHPSFFLCCGRTAPAGVWFFSPSPFSRPFRISLSSGPTRFVAAMDRHAGCMVGRGGTSRIHFLVRSFIALAVSPSLDLALPAYRQRRNGGPASSLRHQNKRQKRRKNFWFSTFFSHLFIFPFVSSFSSCCLLFFVPLISPSCLRARRLLLSSVQFKFYTAWMLE
mmetsp:Transcript_12282/g.23805  ORF Transcript_12282/g.23805 Transcript_12282/m.23805 type:complete len:242 (+) Transcript_12282:1866-2591(+)